MKLPREYIDSLITRKVIPHDSWKYEIINNKACNTIRNITYTHLFWLDLWQNVLSQLFKNQQMIRTIEEIDMSRPVIITENLELISCQPIINNIAYFSTVSLSNGYNPFLLNISIGNITTIYIMLVLNIMLLSVFIKTIFKNINILIL